MYKRIAHYEAYENIHFGSMYYVESSRSQNINKSPFVQASLAPRVLRSTRADPSARCIDELSDCLSYAPGHTTAGGLSPTYRADANEMRNSYIAHLADFHQVSQLTDHGNHFITIVTGYDRLMSTLEVLNPARYVKSIRRKRKKVKKSWISTVVPQRDPSPSCCPSHPNYGSRSSATF